MLSYSRRNPRRDSGAAFANHGETGIGGGNNGVESYAATPRSNAGYAMGGNSGYAPAATETTPQKHVVRDSYGNNSPPPSDNLYKHRAK
jgi:hypothetical protein